MEKKLSSETYTFKMFLTTLWFTLLMIAVTLLFIGLLSITKGYIDHRKHVRLFRESKIKIKVTVKRIDHRNMNSMVYFKKEINKKSISYIKLRFLDPEYLSGLTVESVIPVYYNPEINHVIPVGQLKHFIKTKGYIKNWPIVFIICILILALDPRLLLLGTPGWGVWNMLNQRRGK